MRVIPIIRTEKKVIREKYTLKSCPFCGQDAGLYIKYHEDSEFYIAKVGCTGCDAVVTACCSIKKDATYEGPTILEAVKRWNMREGK